MPPKKKEEVVTKPILGKFSSHLKVRAADGRRARGATTVTAALTPPPA
jgi:hypothetical protein